MEGNQGRRMSAEQKLKIVVNGRQSGATVSEVCRRHQIAHTQFYRWARMAREGALEVLRNGARKANNGKRENWFFNPLASSLEVSLISGFGRTRATIHLR